MGARWLREYPAKHKVVIAGNHDITFQKSYYSDNWERFHRKPYSCEGVKELLQADDSCIYLEDQGIEIAGYQIYGSPWQPEFCDWAFNLDRGEPCRRVWDQIPASPHILMTHGPPQGILDLCTSGLYAGCVDLRAAIFERNVPISLFGHIHEGYGVTSDGVTVFINASTCTHSYRPTNAPIVFDAPPPQQLAEAAALRAKALNTKDRKKILKACDRAAIGAPTPPH